MCIRDRGYAKKIKESYITEEEREICDYIYSVSYTHLFLDNDHAGMETLLHGRCLKSSGCVRNCPTDRERCV